MGALPTVMTGGEAPNYEAWLGSAENADTYTKAQHNGSMATARSAFEAILFAGGGLIRWGSSGPYFFDLLLLYKACKPSRRL